MEKKNSKLYYLLFGITTVVMGMILYPILDLIWAKFVTHSPFVYSVRDHIIDPVVFATIITIVYYFTRKK